MSESVDLKAVHDDAIEGDVEGYHEFLTSYKKHSKSLYGFVEGPDDISFYQSLVEANLCCDSWNLELFPCGGRKKVIATHGEMDWTKYDKKRIVFYVDLDFSDIVGDTSGIGEPNVYITDEYSIENRALNSMTFRRVLKEILGVKSGAILEYYCDLYQSELNSFKNLLHPVTCQIMHWRSSGIDAKLNKIKLSEIYSVKNCKVIQLLSDDAAVRIIHKQCAIALPKKHDVSKCARVLSKKNNISRYARGKFITWFFIEFIKSIQCDWSNMKFSGDSAPTERVSIGKKNALLIIAPRSRAPQSLKRFVNETHNSYIGMHVMSVV